MALICVEAVDANSVESAETLSRTLGLPLYDGTAPTDLKVVVSAAGIGLGFGDTKQGKPYFVDFLTNRWKTRLREGLPKSHIFRRAMGHLSPQHTLVDATAGFGQDSILCLGLGCRVLAVERSPVVATLLKDGVRRAAQDDESWRESLSRLTVVEADAVSYLRQMPPPDVIYLDPMFEKPKKTAKSPKEMQLLQILLREPAANEEELFRAALLAAKSRVVVKRPLKGEARFGAPHHMFKGQSIRFDVYVKAALSNS